MKSKQPAEQPQTSAQLRAALENLEHDRAGIAGEIERERVIRTRLAVDAHGGSASAETELVAAWDRQTRLSRETERLDSVIEHVKRQIAEAERAEAAEVEAARLVALGEDTDALVGDFREVDELCAKLSQKREVIARRLRSFRNNGGACHRSENDFFISAAKNAGLRNAFAIMSARPAIKASELFRSASFHAGADVEYVAPASPSGSVTIERPAPKKQTTNWSWPGYENGPRFEVSDSAPR